MCTQTQQINSKIASILEAVAALNSLVNNISYDLKTVNNDVTSIGAIITSAEATHRPVLIERIKIALNGEHKLRSVDALVDLLEASEDTILQELDDAGIDYVQRRRRRDGAAMLGLSERN